MWLMLKGDGSIEIAATPFIGGADYKRVLVAAMRERMREAQVTAYSFLVRERADRREAVIITAANHWGQSAHRSLEIIRDKRGKCTELRRQDGSEDIISGIYDNLLETRRPQ
jgi:hypothetical protein